MDDLLDRAARLARPLLTVFGAFWLAIGVWAFVAPKSFFDVLVEFEPYNRHLIHDVGAMQIGIGLGALTAARTLRPLVAAFVGLAAGGIVDGASMAAAFALGAEGVQMGTRMVSAAESPVHENWKQAIVNAAETDTLFLNERHSPALRALRTARTEALARAEHNVFGDFGDPHALYFGGDMEAAIALGGQAVGRIDAVRPVADIIGDTVREFVDTVERLAGRALV